MKIKLLLLSLLALSRLCEGATLAQIGSTKFGLDWVAQDPNFINGVSKQALAENVLTTVTGIGTLYRNPDDPTEGFVRHLTPGTSHITMTFKNFTAQKYLFQLQNITPGETISNFTFVNPPNWILSSGDGTAPTTWNGSALSSLGTNGVARNELYIGSNTVSFDFTTTAASNGFLALDAFFAFDAVETPATPEPSSVMLSGLGVLGLLARRRRNG